MILILCQGSKVRRSAECLEASIGIEAEFCLATSPDLVASPANTSTARPGRANLQAYDAEARLRLWQLTEQLTGISL